MAINFKILQRNIVLLTNFRSMYCRSSSYFKYIFFKPDEDLKYIDRKFV